MSLISQKKETLEKIRELMDEAAELIRGLGDMRLEIYVLADLEGATKGDWLGKFARDYVEEAYEDILRREKEFPESEEEE